MTMGRFTPSRDGIRLAIICAVQVEYDAVSLLIDWDDTYEDDVVEGDSNVYKVGWMGNVSIVVLHLRGIGKVRAARAAAKLKMSFPNLKMVFLVGICGGVPGAALGGELFLGDVIISESIVQHDLGKQHPGGFVMSHRSGDHFGVSMTGDLGNLVRTSKIDDWHKRLQDQAAGFLGQLQHKALMEGQEAKYKYPGAAKDRLFAPDYCHRHQPSLSNPCLECSTPSSLSCERSLHVSCDELGCSDDNIGQRSSIEERKRREERQDGHAKPDCRVYLGGFVSSDTLMRSGAHRDAVARRCSAMAFEMEGAGVWEEHPCLIIKGVADYADSHKNDDWQGYAAAAAASVARALVDQHVPLLLADVQGHSKRPAFRSRRMKRDLRRQYGRERLQIYCYRCDFGNHKAPDCRVSETVLWKARENRLREGRCLFCGSCDHWMKDCRYDGLPKGAYDY